MKNPFVRFIVVVLVIVGLVSIVKWTSDKVGESADETTAFVTKNSILQLDLEGVIMNGKKFLKKLKKYKDEDKIKAIVININSPGGAVGPSQEIYEAIKAVKAETKKPIICSSSGLLASGAYYSAVACDKIVVAPGALVGSIGVIMEFANLEKLYDWAKISRFSITSGKFKDSGAEYRQMRPEEKALFQDLINDVYGQFKQAVMDGRGLKDDVVSTYADGRVMTGAQAVKLGFADQLGTLEDAVKLAAQTANLGTDYKLFEAPKRKPSFWDLLEQQDEDDLNSAEETVKFFTSKGADKAVETSLRKVFRAQYLNQPMMIMPGFWE
ncbi:signal peptide peptidase SppA [Bdellovibrio sp. HCB337]|uniref:signal peptide peptidase SppA n=1 Tax=Bdellovibrio sp. HCB337 TaxID=3394358 RepID=UPI0039A65181